MDSTITLRKYLAKNKVFIVPDYQRGYIWGKNKTNTNDLDSVSYILNTIFEKMSAGESIFLQGVTVSETTDSIILIDGQQRTTFLYILLKLLGYKEYFEIRYDIREESKQFLQKLGAGPDNIDYKEDENEEFQDIFYFKKSARLIFERLNKEDYDRRDIMEYLLDKIRFLYINIPVNQATKVFTMMNGNRAKMFQTEIIKAELLRLVSLSGEGMTSTYEWELNLLRSRYAREWDKWVHRWNRYEVKSLFKTSSQLGWLLVAVLPDQYTETNKVTFESFCKEILGKSRSIKSAKDTFYRLRKTQKIFEDTYDNPIRHNMVGAIIRISRDKAKFVKYYFSEKNISDEELFRYYHCSFLSMTHDNIIAEDKIFWANFCKRFNEVLGALKLSKIYDDKDGNKEEAFRLLLRLNIDEDNRQNKGLGRRFDFSIWDEGLRSLEHIYSKSDVFHKDEQGNWFNGNDKPGTPKPDSLIRENIGKIDDPVMPVAVDIPEGIQEIDVTEHCIGNLVLLYRDDNSTFNANTFNRKKEIFLVGEEKDGRKEFFKSRHLLHTVYHFAESEWGATEIKKYFADTLIQFRKPYSTIISKFLPNTDND